MGASAADPLFSDSFSGAANRRPDGWRFDTADEMFWTVQNGWLVSGDGNDMVTVDGFSFGVIETPGSESWTDYRIACRFRMKNSSGRVALAGRWIDRRNHYRATVDVLEGARRVTLTKAVRGVRTDLQSVPLVPEAVGLARIENGSADAPIDFALAFKGSTIVVSLAGQVVAFAKDASLPKGTAGVGLSRNNVAFQNVAVTTVTEDPLAPSSISPERRASVPGQYYTVRLLTTRDVAEARGTAASLRDMGYFPNLEQDEEGRHAVSIGRFSSFAEATKMRVEMVSNDFAFAKVVAVEAKAGEAPQPGTTAPSQAVDTTIPPGIRARPDLQVLTPSQRQELIRMLIQQRAARLQIQTFDQLAELTRQVQSLTEDQKKILMKLSEEEADSEERKRSISRLVASIDRGIEQGDYDGALAGIAELEKIDPLSPIAAMKKEDVTHLKDGTYPGYDAQMSRLQKDIASLKQQAIAMEGQQRLDEAKQIWVGIIAKDPDNEEARQKVESLNARIDAMRTQTAAEARQKERMLLFTVVGSVGGVLLVLLALIYLLGRRRYAQMLQQLQDEAVAPLQELRQRTRAIAAGGGAAGLALDGGRDLLEQADSSDAEFMIPEAGVSGAAPPEESSPFRPADSAPPVEAAPSPFAPAEESPPGDVLAEFGDLEGEEEERQPSSVLPLAPSDAETSMEDAVLSFGDLAPESLSEFPAAGSRESAPETPGSPGGAAADEIVFSFDDSVPGTSAEETSRGEDTTTSALSDLDLDLDLDLGPSASGADQAIGGGAGDGETPLSPLDLDLDLRTEEQSPPKGVGSSPLLAETVSPLGGNVCLSQDYSVEAVGAAPKGWTGGSAPSATLRVVEDDKNPGEKCLRFRKPAGEAATSFACRFPNASGRVTAEFDIRCDEKNKHLLGLYLEEDGDFRRAVHTVVQCTDPSSPAYLRIFNQATPYDLGSWRRVRYEIDLEEGLVNGYIDGQLVAGNVRMGAKASNLNTVSIRDNTESTGALYLKNLSVREG